MTWYPVSDTSFYNGPIAASANPGSIGNGFTDVAGNVWSINSSNALQQVLSVTNPWQYQVLARLATWEQSLNSQQIMRWIPGSSNSLNALYAFSRYKNPGTSATGYILGVNSNGVLQAFTVTAGALSFALTPTSTTGSFSGVGGVAYDVTTTTVQTNGTTTTLTLSIANTSGVVIATSVWTDTTAALQNYSGACGTFIFGSSAPNDTITRIQTFSDSIQANATSYSVSLPSKGVVGTSFTGQVALSGGNLLTSNLVISVVDSLGSVIATSPITFSNGAVTSTFTVNPSVIGSHALTYSHTGGNAGMTGDGNYTVTVVGFTLLTNSPACVMSPYNWSVGSLGVGTSQTWNSGAYARFYVKGTTSATLLLDSAVTTGYVYYQIDNGPLVGPTQVPGTGQIAITIPDTGSHVVFVTVASLAQNAGRWARTLYVGLQGLQLGSGGVADTNSVVLGTQKILIYGDSITEGIKAFNGSDGNAYDYSYYLGQALLAQGFEYGIVGCGSQGYTTNGAGSVPPVFTIGNDSQSAWNKVDQSTSRMVNGLFSPQPNIIFDNHGANDGLQNHGGNALSPTLATTITSFYQALRAAAPGALIIKSVPFGGYARSDIATGIAGYQASNADPNQLLVDLAIDTRLTGGLYTNFGDYIHPGVWGHANIGTMVVGAVTSAYSNFLRYKYTTTTTQGLNYLVDADATITIGSSTVNVRKGMIISNHAEAQLLLNAGAKLLAHP